MKLGFSRKRLGKLHKAFFKKRLRKEQEQGQDSAFQQNLSAAVRAMLDVVAANNQKISNDLRKIFK
ncbi:MAG: hypothetical protein N3A57_00470 [Negativicutes bacterium]|nr:hypothetical protein [Negativicutes bacterium]